MLRGPKLPSAPGKLNQFVRRTAAHNQQRSAAITGGSTTTKGFVANAPRRFSPARSGEVEQFMVVTEYQNHLRCVRATCDLVADSAGRIFDVDQMSAEEIAAAEQVRIMKPPELRANLFDFVARGGLLIGDVDGYRYEYASDAPWIRNVTLTDPALLAEFETSGDGAGLVNWDEEVWPPYTLTLPAAASSVAPNRKIIDAMKVKQRPLSRVIEVTHHDNAPDTSESFDPEWEDMNVASRAYVPKLRRFQVCNDSNGDPVFVLIRAMGSFTLNV